MNKIDLKKFADSRADMMLEHYSASQEKYERLWNIYDQRMQSCITGCKRYKESYADDVWLDGPQGLYWIGANPQILFVGREHYGWYGESQWPADMPSIFFAPLEFAFYTVASMGSYWGVVKGLIQEVLQLGLADWDKALRSVAFTNACKCLTNSRTYQWQLHQRCLQQRYLEDEIVMIHAPLNVLFTKSYDLSSKLFPGRLRELSKNADFVISELGEQIIIECAHPGRQSSDWRNTLSKIMIENLDKCRR